MAINWKQYPVSKTLSASDTVIASRPDGSTFNIDSPISCNRSGVTITGTLTVTGTLTGNVTGNADTATTATNVTVADESTDTTCFPLFATAATGDLPLKSGTNLTFNSNTGDLNTSTLTIADYIIHDGDVTTKIGFDNNDVFSITTDNVVRFTQNNTSALFTTKVQIPLRVLKRSDTGVASESTGDVVFFGNTTSMVAGKIYHLKNDSSWELVDASAVATSDGLLAVALGEESNSSGMLLRGFVTLEHDPGAIGDVLYASHTATGEATATKPTGTGNVVRILGYCLGASDKKIFFNPDNHYTVL